MECSEKNTFLNIARSVVSIVYRNDTAILRAEVCWENIIFGVTYKKISTSQIPLPYHSFMETKTEKTFCYFLKGYKHSVLNKCFVHWGYPMTSVSSHYAFLLSPA